MSDAEIAFICIIVILVVGILSYIGWKCWENKKKKHESENDLSGLGSSGGFVTNPTQASEEDPLNPEGAGQPGAIERVELEGFTNC